jgi:hypothetical protein
MAAREVWTLPAAAALVVAVALEVRWCVAATNIALDSTDAPLLALVGLLGTALAALTGTMFALRWIWRPRKTGSWSVALVVLALTGTTLVGSAALFFTPVLGLPILVLSLLGMLVASRWA